MRSVLAAGRILQQFLSRLSPRRRRRAAMLSTPFPTSWRQVLSNSCAHYRRLPTALRNRFEDQVRLFVAERQITGVDVDVTDELRVLVAASAATLSVGWEDYDWSEVREVLLYPDSFGRDFAHGPDGDRAGVADPWGTVILSAPALIGSFEIPDDGYHLGIHEFAHLLDMDATRFDGNPSWLPEGRLREWELLRSEEMERMINGESVLDGYGALDPVEFLAVAMESFFERPVALRENHGRLYEMLASYLGQDPAAWEGNPSSVAMSASRGLPDTQHASKDTQE